MEDFRKNLSVSVNAQQVEWVTTSLRCFDNSDDKSANYNFHLSLIQLWMLFSDIFVNGNVVDI